jgi:hypothetical protein
MPVSALFFRSSNIPQEDTATYVPMTPAQTLDEDPNSDQMFPRKIISDDHEYLNLLFDLLSNPVVMDEAWKLLEVRNVSRSYRVN